MSWKFKFYNLYPNLEGVNRDLSLLEGNTTLTTMLLSCFIYFYAIISSIVNFNINICSYVFYSTVSYLLCRQFLRHGTHKCARVNHKTYTHILQGFCIPTTVFIALTSFILHVLLKFQVKYINLIKIVILTQDS